MDIKRILSAVDHTLLKPEATWSQIKVICDDAIKYGTASVCIPASYVERAYKYIMGEIPICTVIGFPNGYSTTKIKCAETVDAVRNGASEIDMVINIGWVKDGKYDWVLDEIKKVRESCHDSLLKVIVEACLLSEEEKINMCKVVSESGADYIKTSTGFSSGGATKEDIILFSKNISNGVKIKAAGGISTLEDAEEFLNLGASRLGTSRIIKIIKEMNI